MADSTVASPSKRMRPGSGESAARAVITLLLSEPTILETIVGFVPTTASETVVREAVEKEDDKGKKDEEDAEGEDGSDEEEEEEEDEDDEPEEEGAEMHTRYTVDHTLSTIGALCRALPSLSKELGPENTSFWRAMVLRRFDFTENGWRFNVKDYDDSRWGRGPDANDHPIRIAIEEYRAAGGEEVTPQMLANGLSFWPSIGAYFRPAEYAFLGQIQTGCAAITTWPEDEDPYTLYRDLSLLQHKLSKFEELETWSDGEQLVSPCFLRRMDGEIKDGGFELLQHCDFVPLYWDGFVHNRWSGFDEPLPPRLEKVYDDADDRRTEEEQSIFPMTPFYFRCFEGLRRLVYESFDDWRRVHANPSWGEYPSAEFYIGRRKLSGRWLGFVGQSDYCGGATPK